jgi:hypothetical protein
VSASPRGPSVAPIERLQGTLPAALRAIPLQVLLAGAGLGLITVLVTGMALARSDRVIAALEDDGPARPGAVASSTGTPGTTAPEVPQLSAAELAAARVTGTPGLLALALRFPNDPAVLLALGVAQVREKDLASGVRTLRRVLDASPDARADRDLQQALLDVANGPPEIAPEAFDLLQTRMGSAGPDLLFDLSQTATGKYAKEHVTAALDDAALMKGASRALLVADELRRKTPCQRRSTVSRAAADGDARSLPFLRQMVATRPCGGFTALFRGSDCPVNVCLNLQDRASVAAAVAAIEKRDPAAKAPAPSAAAPAASPGQAGGHPQAPGPTAPPRSGGGSTLR